MRKLWLSKGASRYDPPVAGKATWDALVKKLTTFSVTDESFDEYMTIKDRGGVEALKIKDVGWFVGGPFKHNTRRKEYLRFRSILALDIDHLDSWEVDDILEAYDGYAYVIHSSHAHSNTRPRLRLVMPFSRNVLLHEYEAIGRMVASWTDNMDAFDDTGFQVSRVMFWPSRARDGDEFVRVGEGKWLDPDEVLAMYDDATDFASWPHSSRVQTARPMVDKAESPFSKPGVIGAFNRAYPIDLAIEKFELPYVASGLGEGRYSLTTGSSVDGAIYYEDDGHLYSWHESDPARGNHHAFDLVRLHKFGNLDPSNWRDSNPSELESYKAMTKWAMSLPEVAEEMAKGEGFEELSTEEQERRKGITFDALNAEIRDAPEITHTTLQSVWLPRIATAKLPTAQSEALLRRLQDHLDITLDALRKDLRRHQGRFGSVIVEDGNVEDTERQLALEVLKEHYADGLHIRRVGKLYWTYNHGVWLKDDEERVKGAIQKTIIRLRTERPEDVEALVAAIGESRTTALTDAIHRYMSVFLAEQSGIDDPLHLCTRLPMPVINARNCELHFDGEGTLLVGDHDPDNFYTTQLAIDYEPNAKCPEWDRFCKILFYNSLEPEEMQRHLEEVCGYAIQMSRWLKTWVLLHGPTNTGKTTVADVLKAMLGNAALEQPLQTFEGTNVSSFAKASLIGKLVVADDDQNKNVVLPDGFIKKVSEEKIISSDIKYGDQLSFISRALPFVLSNHWPQARDLSDALRERALVFDFNHPIPANVRSDTRKNRMLNEELPGILNRFIAGIARLRARGGWDMPFECCVAREKWVGQSNALALFIDDRLKTSHGAPLINCVKSSDLWAAYTSWCRAEGLDRRNQLTRRNMFQQLEALTNGNIRRAKDRYGLYRISGVTGVDVTIE